MAPVVRDTVHCAGMREDFTEPDRSRQSDRRVCLGCLHDLTGTDLRCPECGRAFEAADPRTWWRSRPARIERWLMRCGPWFHGLIALAVLMVACASSVPGSFFVLHVLGVLMLGVLGVLWILKFLARIEVRLRLGGPGPIARREWGFVTAPAIAVAGVLLAASDLPLRLALAAAGGSLERLRAEQAGVPRTTFSPPAVAGWQRIERMERLWLFLQDLPIDGWEGPETDAWIVNVTESWVVAQDPAEQASFEAGAADPSSLLRPGSQPAAGMRLVEVMLLEVEHAGFIGTGCWGWLPDGPDTLRGAEMTWRRISGDWYAVERGF